MNYIIMDLEWNIGVWPAATGYFDEIIEIGAVKLNENLELIDRFSSFVRPNINKKLNCAVKNLTNIEISALNKAESFCNVYKRFEQWCAQGNIFLTWSQTDITVILKNLKFYKMGERISCMQAYCDVQVFVQDRLHYDKNQMALSAAAQALDIDCKRMDLHRAQDDAEVTARCFKKVYDTSFHEYVNTASSEFYKRILFKNRVLMDYDNPLIKKSSLMVKCPVCGLYAKRTEKWHIKNKQFTSCFKCGRCNRSYTGRIRVRLEYEGITVVHKVKENKSEEGSVH